MAREPAERERPARLSFATSEPATPEDLSGPAETQAPSAGPDWPGLVCCWPSADRSARNRRRTPTPPRRRRRPASSSSEASRMFLTENTSSILPLRRCSPGFSCRTARRRSDGAARDDSVGRRLAKQRRRADARDPTRKIHPQSPWIVCGRMACRFWEAASTSPTSLHGGAPRSGGPGLPVEPCDGNVDSARRSAGVCRRIFLSGVRTWETAKS